MIDLDRFQAMTNEQLADELDAMVDRAIEQKVKGPRELVEIAGLIPLLTQRLRKKDDYITIPRLD